MSQLASKYYTVSYGYCRKVVKSLLVWRKKNNRWFPRAWCQLVPAGIMCMIARYYGILDGWSKKNHGKLLELDEHSFTVCWPVERNKETSWGGHQSAFCLTRFSLTRQPVQYLFKFMCPESKSILVGFNNFTENKGMTNGLFGYKPGWKAQRHQRLLNKGLYYDEESDDDIFIGHEIHARGDSIILRIQKPRTKANKKKAEHWKTIESRAIIKYGKQKINSDEWHYEYLQKSKKQIYKKNCLLSQFGTGVLWVYFKDSYIHWGIKIYLNDDSIITTECVHNYRVWGRYAFHQPVFSFCADIPQGAAVELLDTHFGYSITTKRSNK